jgi:hypothetical protein
MIVLLVVWWVEKTLAIISLEVGEGKAEMQRFVMEEIDATSAGTPREEQP